MKTSHVSIFVLFVSAAVLINPIAYGATVPFSPTVIDFGAVTMGQVASETVTITNDTAFNLDIDVHFTADRSEPNTTYSQSITLDGVGISLEFSDVLPGNSVNFDVEFSPISVYLPGFYHQVFSIQTSGHSEEGLLYVSGTAVVPIPPAAWLFGSGLLGLVGIARRQRVTAL